MALPEILILGLALSMDAFAVTVSNLLCYPRLSRGRRLALPLVFGFLQGLMPLIGYFLGSIAAEYINQIAGPVALVLLGFIGGKMIYESARDIRTKRKSEAPPPEIAISLTKEDRPVPTVTLSIPAIFIQGIATSIDALIVGISLLALGVNIFEASSLIALTTFACCLVALVIGRRFGELLGDNAQLIGGIVLVLIGIKACFF
jgi:putative Mn2+ efflux pump MntP